MDCEEGLIRIRTGLAAYFLNFLRLLSSFCWHLLLGFKFKIKKNYEFCLPGCFVFNVL